MAEIPLPSSSSIDEKFNNATSTFHCSAQDCAVRKYSVESMRDHISLTHLNYTPYECKACHCNSTSAQQLQLHIRTAHRDQSAHSLTAYCGSEALEDELDKLLLLVTESSMSRQTDPSAAASPEQDSRQMADSTSTDITIDNEEPIDTGVSNAIVEDKTEETGVAAAPSTSELLSECVVRIEHRARSPSSDDNDSQSSATDTNSNSISQNGCSKRDFTGPASCHPDKKRRRIELPLRAKKTVTPNANGPQTQAQIYSPFCSECGRNVNLPLVAGRNPAACKTAKIRHILTVHLDYTPNTMYVCTHADCRLGSDLEQSVVQHGLDVHKQAHSLHIEHAFNVPQSQFGRMFRACFMTPQAHAQTSKAPKKTACHVSPPIRECDVTEILSRRGLLAAAATVSELIDGAIRPVTGARVAGVRCLVCGFIVPNTEPHTLRTHVTVAHLSHLPIYACPAQGCSVASGDADDVMKHYLLRHEDEEKEKRSPRTINSAKSVLDHSQQFAQQIHNGVQQCFGITPSLSPKEKQTSGAAGNSVSLPVAQASPEHDDWLFADLPCTSAAPTALKGSAVSVPVKPAPAQASATPCSGSAPVSAAASVNGEGDAVQVKTESVSQCDLLTGDSSVMTAQAQRTKKKRGRKPGWNKVKARTVQDRMPVIPGERRSSRLVSPHKATVTQLQPISAESQSVSASGHTASPMPMSELKDMQPTMTSTPITARSAVPITDRLVSVPSATTETAGPGNIPSIRGTAQNLNSTVQTNAGTIHSTSTVTQSKPVPQSATSNRTIAQSVNQSPSSSSTVTHPVQQSALSKCTVTQPVHQAPASKSTVTHPVHKSAASNSTVTQPVHQAPASKSTVTHPVHKSAASNSTVTQPVHQAPASKSTVTHPVHKSAASNSTVTQPVHRSAASNSTQSNVIEFSSLSDMVRVFGSRAADVLRQQMQQSTEQQDQVPARTQQQTTKATNQRRDNGNDATNQRRDNGNGAGGELQPARRNTAAAHDINQRPVTALRALATQLNSTPARTVQAQTYDTDDTDPDVQYLQTTPRKPSAPPPVVSMSNNVQHLTMNPARKRSAPVSVASVAPNNVQNVTMTQPCSSAPAAAANPTAHADYLANAFAVQQVSAWHERLRGRPGFEHYVRCASTGSGGTLAHIHDTRLRLTAQWLKLSTDERESYTRQSVQMQQNETSNMNNTVHCSTVEVPAQAQTMTMSRCNANGREARTSVDEAISSVIDRMHRTQAVRTQTQHSVTANASGQQQRVTVDNAATVHHLPHPTMAHGNGMAQNSVASASMAANQHQLPVSAARNGHAANTNVNAAPSNGSTGTKLTCALCQFVIQAPSNVPASKLADFYLQQRLWHVRSRHCTEAYPCSVPGCTVSTRTYDQMLAHYHQTHSHIALGRPIVKPVDGVAPRVMIDKLQQCYGNRNEQFVVMRHPTVASTSTATNSDVPLTVTPGTHTATVPINQATVPNNQSQHTNRVQQPVSNRRKNTHVPLVDIADDD